MNYLFTKPWKKTLFFILFTVSLFSLLLSIFFWNKIGYINVIRFLIFFVIFIVSALSLCIFCLKNALKYLKINESIRKESIGKVSNTNKKEKVIKEELINKVITNIEKPMNNEKIDYNKKTVIELKAIAKQMHIKGYSKLKKAELIKKIKANVK